jgi:hypothetical protein
MQISYRELMYALIEVLMYRTSPRVSERDITN